MSLRGSSSHSSDIELNSLAETEKKAQEVLEIRRKQEKKLIQQYDRSKIDINKECWYLIDSSWLNDWSNFVHGDLDPPDMMSSKALIDKDRKVLPGLRSRIDYRGVTPLVFYMFLDLYGHDNTPQFCRYTIDIYAHPVPIERLVDIQYRAQTEASIQVQKIRKKWVKWERENDDDEKDDGGICCGLTKQHIEVFIYWMIMCWSRKKSGRKNIRYRSYKPLKTEESTHGYDSSLDDDEESQIVVVRADKERKRSWLLSFLGR